jgi:phenylacetate-CoA ligase
MNGLRRALIRLYMRARQRDVLRSLSDMEASQWRSPEEIRDLQTARLRAMLTRAQREVPYYAEILRQARLDPREATVAGLSALPVLERETLQERFDDLTARGARPGTRVRATGGSTGRGVRVLVDHAEMVSRAARQYRNLRWIGWDLGGRLAYVWGSDVDARDHRGLAGRARDAARGILWLDAFSMEGRRLDQDLDRLRRHDPDVLIGYPSSLHLLARRLLDTGRHLPLRGIETSAEVLTEGVRRDLREAFGCEVRDRYGCREAGIVAHECPQGRLHVNAESILVEVVKGSLLLTTLDNHVMPLVRYRNEDLGEALDEACPCGRGLPALRSILGRSSDIIRSPSGRLIHGEFFTHLFYEAAGVTRFQVRQTDPERLVISVVAGDVFDDAARSRVERLIREHGDPRFAVEWRRVAEIPAGPSGKYRFTLSDLG